MTEANLKAYALANGYAKNYKEMSQWEKVQLRAAFVMDATKNSAGDFERTSDSAANQTKLFTESLKELGSSFGQEILPTITTAISKLNETIKSFGNLDSGTKKTIITIAALAAAIGPITIVAGQTATGVGALIKVFAKLKTASATSAAATAAMGTAETAAGTAGTAGAVGVTTFGTAVKAAMGPIGIAIAAISVLAIAFSAISARYKKEREELLNEKYDKLQDKSDKYYNRQVNNLEKEKQAYSDSLTKRENDINAFYDAAEKAAEDYVKTTKKALKEESEAITAEHQKRLKEIEAEKKARLEQIDSEVDTATEALQSKIDALDSQTETEDKIKEEKENSEKEAELRAAINYAKTVKERVDAQKALNDFLVELEQKKTLELREEEKKQLQNQINNIKTEADRKKEAVETDIENKKNAADAELKINQEATDVKLEALDGYVDSANEKYITDRNNAITAEQEKSAAIITEIDARILKYQEEQKAADEALKDKKDKELKEKPKTENLYVMGSNIKVVSPKGRAVGDTDWEGGPVQINEEGGEILNLPRHTQIIPHDVSMEAAREYGKQKAINNNTSTVYNQYGAQQQVTILSVDGKTIANVVQPTISTNLKTNQTLRRRASGAY